jgi:predicted MFS family arabinose efflux permease
VYQIFWSFVVPVMMGIFNDVDPSGRLIVFCLSAFKVGLMLGPPIAALAISTFSLTAVLPLGAVAIVLSALCLQLAQRRNN